MREQDLKNFADSTLGYFSQLTGKPAQLGVPYVKKPEDQLFSDFTGIIGISGNHRGGMYVTATRKFLEELLQFTGFVGAPTEDALRDMAGELANTIAGNASKSFGKGYDISVPIILQGAPDKLVIKVEPPCYVLPVEWQQHKFHIVIGISP
jgi:chemotaxis protein CheX